MSYLLGIDVGSSSVKVGLFTPDGHPAGLATRSYPTSEPSPGHKEQDPEQWWAAVVSALREVGAGGSLDQVLAIAVTGHISSLTFVDFRGNHVRPAIGFQDQRASTQVEELYTRISKEQLACALGIDLPPAPTWPLPRLMWLQRNEPRTLEDAHRVLQAKDFINLRLTGEFVSDASSNRGLVDLNSGCPAHDVFSRLALPVGLLPRICNPTEIIGLVSHKAAKETGLPPSLRVAAGWNDLNACVLGGGAVEAGDAFNVTGTSDHVGLVTNRKCSHPKLIYAPFLPGTSLLYGVTAAGGGSLQWYSSAFGRRILDLLSLAEGVPAGSASLYFLPYLEGERAPIWDSNASGVFIGIRTMHRQSHFARAILEGVAFSLAQIFKLVLETAPETDSPIIVSGGAGSIDLWNQIKTDIFERPVLTPDVVQTGVLGAAILGAVATGVYASCEEAVSAMVRLKKRFAPCSAKAGLYRDRYLRFCELYPALKDCFKRIHESTMSYQNEKESECKTTKRL